MSQPQFSKEYIIQYLDHLGLAQSQENYRIAQWALQAPVPVGWNEGISDEGDIYFWRENAQKEKQIKWEHPIDDVLKQWGRDNADRQIDKAIQTNQRTNDNLIQDQNDSIQVQKIVLEDPLYQKRREVRQKMNKQAALQRFENMKSQLKKELWNEIVQENQVDQIDLLYDDVDKEINSVKSNLNSELLNLTLLKDKLNDQVFQQNNFQKINSLNKLREQRVNKQILTVQNDIDMQVQQYVDIELSSHQTATLKQQFLQKLFTIISNQQVSISENYSSESFLRDRNTSTRDINKTLNITNSSIKKINQSTVNETKMQRTSSFYF